MRSGSVCLSVVMALGMTGALSQRLLAAEASGVVGTWRGESACATDAPACRNESVVYYIKEVPNRSDLVSIRADKIVDGQSITMGTGEWKYDSSQHTLEWRTARQAWLLKVIGDHIEGTLTLADGTVFRKMKLEKQ